MEHLQAMAFARFVIALAQNVEEVKIAIVLVVQHPTSLLVPNVFIPVKKIPFKITKPRPVINVTHLAVPALAKKLVHLALLKVYFNKVNV
jgi:hypothetical protein